MQIEVLGGLIQKQTAQAIVVNLFEDVTQPTGATGAVDTALNGQIQALIASGDFKGKCNEIAVLYPGAESSLRRVLLVGLGKAEQLKEEGIRQAAATAAQKARDLGVTHLYTVVHGAGAGGIEPQRAAQAVVEGSLLGLYRYDEFKTQPEGAPTEIEKLTLVEVNTEWLEAINDGVRAGQIIAEATALARDLSNCPGNVANATYIAEQAQHTAKDCGLKYQVVDKAEMEQLGMDLLLSVNRGSAVPAQMVVLEHNAEREGLPTLVLVGKGITFDSGGISIKPGQGMERMKSDMSGAATVVGVLAAAARLELPLHVVGILPLTDNMPDAHATCPGDVVYSLKGLTVEIINTDAEGRLVLADALTYAAKFEPQALLDIATLTGARVVALGKGAAAVMGDDALIAKLRTAGETTYERVWPLPLFEEYFEQIKSPIADVKNIGGRDAGTISAGCFLNKFIPEDTPWVHIDIAGLEHAEEAHPYVPKGATAFGTRLLIEFLRAW